MSLLSIFATAILPLVAIASAGAILGRYRDVDAGPLNTVTIYVLAPALVFHSLATSPLDWGTLAGIGVGVLLFSAVMAGLADGLGRLVGETEPVLGSFVLVSTFGNAGNYGIPLSEFAFGPVGRTTAVTYIVAQSVAMYTLGVYLANRGEGSDLRAGLKTIFTLPLIYAVVAALALRTLDAVPAADTAAMEMVQLVGDSAIPVMLLILGIELASAVHVSALRRVTLPTLLKLVVSPIVAVAVVVGIAAGFDAVGALPAAFGNETVARVFVLECATPAAVTTLILSSEFSGPSEEGHIDAAGFTSTAIFVSTVLSVPLLTGLIALLQGGYVV